MVITGLMLGPTKEKWNLETSRKMFSKVKFEESLRLFTLPC